MCAWLTQPLCYGVQICSFPFNYVLRGNILELIKKGHVHYTDIEKKTVATCLHFATSNTVRKQFYHYLLINGYVEESAEASTKSRKKEKNC